MNILAAAVVGYLALTLFVGLWFSRKQPNTLEEYALASRSLSTIALTVSFIATFLGSGDIEMMDVAYKHGLRMLISYTAALLLGLFILYKYVYPRLIGEGYLTLGDLIEPLFGKNARVLIGLGGAVYCFGYITSELTMMGHFASMAGMSPTLLILLAGTSLVLYTVTGGVRSVAITDFLQFVFIVAGLFFLSKLACIRLGGFKSIFSQIWANPDYHSHIAIWEDLPKWWGDRLSKTVFWAWPVTFLSPPFFQRIVMSSSRRQLGGMVKFFSCFFGVFSLLVITISFGGLLLPSVQAEVPQQKVFLLAFVHALVHSKAGLLLVLLLVLSVMLSVADSFLNAGSVVLVRDVVKPLFKDSVIDELRWVKIVGIFLGIGSIAFSCTFGQLPADLHYAAGRVLLSIAVCPLISGILGLKTTPRMFWACVGSFLLVSVGVGATQWNHVLGLGKGIERLRYIWHFALPASVSVFFVMHIFEFGKFAQKRESASREFLPKQEDRGWFQFSSLVEAARERARKYGKENVLFPLFMSVVYMLPSITGTQSIEDHVGVETIILSIGVGLCALLLGRVFWPPQALRGFSLYYFISLGYCLPFFFTFRFFCDPADPLSIVCYALASLLLSALVDVNLFVLLTILGNIGAVITWKLYRGDWLPTLDFDQGWGIIWTFFASLVVGFFFGRRRQNRYDLLHEGLLQAAARERQLNTDYLHALDHSQAFVDNLEEQCLDSLERDGRLLMSGKLESSKVEHIAEKMILSAVYLRQLDRHLYGHLTLSLSPYSLEEVARAVLGTAPLPSDRIQLELDGLSLQETVRWDLPKIKEVVLQALLALDQTVPEEDLLLIRFDRVTISYREEGKLLKEAAAVRLLIREQQRRLLPEEKYVLDLEASDTDRAGDILTSRVQRIVEAHRGKLEQGDGYYILVLPQQVNDVRPKKLDNPAISKEQLEKAIHTVLPEEAELRAELQSAGLLTPDIEKAITFMKKYHAGQKRKLEGPFAIHPLECASIVLSYLQSHPQPKKGSSKEASVEQILIAALLHDVVEDTKADFSLIGSIGGPAVQQMVARVSKLTMGPLSLKLENEEAAEKFTDVSDPIGYYAALIKLADRLHNLRTIDGHPKLEKRKKIARETEKVYFGLARQLGAKEILLEMRRICEGVLGEKFPPL